ncbi:TRM11 family SAM-dependent methyltransferase [Lederbergia citrea]|uniref:RNA methyltransferase n=1 Tax=Lederbergia citrea TaxID=2833581 RepID=A0A942Z414_9BACI|nr:RNA methyltransferase [Lederbergia citrea]MBS4176842.1 RNA methyltransferase [Lederbergia citrea]MBS4203402.1 RNA methyltransferase [Lederbergia citrea]MBS4221925.1 RNA methyltransferase [Lederbergia citrea]
MNKLENQSGIAPSFIYTYAWHEDEQLLCQLEMRSFFGVDTHTNVLESSIAIDPSRSPFMKERLEVIFSGESLQEILKQVENINMNDSTFKVTCINDNDLETTKKLRLTDRRRIEREIGMVIEGEPDFEQPDHDFGILTLNGHWYFGKYRKSDAVWYRHIKKPRSYSIALSTRVARAVANIAVPNPHGVKAIDPCCGIGTVLVEALSMGIDIVGRDINPLVTTGSRENIAHFGLVGEVTLGPISDVSTNYDVAIIDLPYNIYSHTTSDQQLSILKHARRFAKKVVIITIETIDDMINEAGFEIVDRCVAKKGSFSRQIIVCD